MSARYKVVCGCKCCISTKIIHLSLLSWRDCYFKKLKDVSQNAQNRRSGEKENRIYETYKNTVMPHGRHVYAKSYDMAKATMCVYSQSDHALPHWKCVFQFCTKCPSIGLPDQKIYDQYPDTSPSICFHIYHMIARCKKNGRLPLTDKKHFLRCQQDTASGQPAKIYNIK